MDDVETTEIVAFLVRAARAFIDHDDADLPFSDEVLELRREVAHVTGTSIDSMSVDALALARWCLDEAQRLLRTA